MTGAEIGVLTASALVGIAVSRALVPLSVNSAPERLVRTNVSGRRVPAVLGWPLVAGALAGLCVVAAAASFDVVGPAPMRPAWSVAAGLLLLAGAGYLDDVRGDEVERGFRGHLRAAASGRFTGGMLKMAAGAAAGLVAGLFLASGWAVLEVALIVALASNLVNLLDRAPGRATKASLLMWGVAALAGPVGYLLASVGPAGALAATLPADLRERGMLGDAGAGPAGGLVGVGLALAGGGWVRHAILVALVLLNLASERWSFSRVIEGNDLLRKLDDLGRPTARK